jgi:hypothetical protein
VVNRSVIDVYNPELATFSIVHDRDDTKAHLSQEVVLELQGFKVFKDRFGTSV